MEIIVILHGEPSLSKSSKLELVFSYWFNHSHKKQNGLETNKSLFKSSIISIQISYDPDPLTNIEKSKETKRSLIQYYLKIESNVPTAFVRNASLKSSFTCR